MFTIGDLRTIAIQIERNGEETYRRAGDLAKDPELKALLYWMADEEQKHLQWFERLQAPDQVACEMVDLEHMGQALLQEMMTRQTFSLSEDQLGQSETVEDLLLRSREFEEDTILFYELLRDFLEDEQAARQLDLIIAEEREHVQKLRAAVSPKSDGAQRTPSG